MVSVRNDSLCNRALEYLLACEADELGDLTVAKIARALEVSESYLARLFKFQRSFSLREYLLREKMLRSAFLLMKEPYLTVKELSEKMGFLDSNYFAYIFKNHFGISPGRYRECKKINPIPGRK